MFNSKFQITFHLKGFKYGNIAYEMHEALLCKHSKENLVVKLLYII